MKQLYQFLAIGGIIAISSCTTPRYTQQDNSYNNQDNYSQQDYSQQQQPGPITYQQFYNDLSPYGNWVNYSNYGYVWVPDVPNFRPYYSNGQWVYTNYGWTWASNYNWGWAPFHYGRWIDDMAYGWMWVPGYEWAPAWVSWRGGNDYYGWAPLGPRMSVNVSVGSIPQNNWAFVPRRYINSPQINNYYVDRSKNVTIIKNTTIINNTTINNNNTTIINKTNNRNTTVYNQGPSATEVERSTGAPIRKINIVESNKPEAPQISNNSIRVYRPAVNTQPANSANTRPTRVTTLQEIQTNRQNNRTNENNVNNRTAAPVRVVPQNQAPQINRNEPPVNNSPSVFPNRNNEPVRTFPNNNQNSGNPANRNQQPVNSAPVQAPQRNIERQNNAPVNNPASQSQPVRRTDNTQPAPTNNNNTNSNIRNPNTIQRNVQQQKPAVQNNPATHQPNQRMVRENRQINNIKPAQHVIRKPQVKPQEQRQVEKEDKAND